MTKYWAKRFKNIILTGMPGAGKSAFGKIYALHSERFFLDFDAYVENITKKTIPQIFIEEGEEGFRTLEEKILHKLERRHNFVIAMGGGTLQKPECIQFARRLGLIVFLDTPIEKLSNRIWNEKEKRPLFKECQTYEQLTQKLEELRQARMSAYEESDVIIKTEFNTLDTLTLHLANIEKRAGNREYMNDIYNIMNKKDKKTQKWSEKDDEPMLD